MTMRIRTLLMTPILFAVVVMGAGCEKGTVIPSLSSTSTPTTAVAITKALPKESDQKLPQEVPLQKAWNQDAIQTIDAFLPDQRAWLPLAIDQNGTFLASIPSQKGHPGGQLALYSLGTGKTEMIASLTGQSQVSSADINEKWVVWTETLDQSMLNWKIHLFDRSTHLDRIVAESAHDANGNGYPGPIVMPKLFGDDFVYSPSIGAPNDKGTNIVVLKYNILTGKTTQLAEGANPILTPNFTLWEGRDDAAKATALFWNKGGTTQQITADKPIPFFATDGTDVAWSSFDANAGANAKWTIGLIQNGTERVLLSTESSNALQFLTFSPRILAWTAYQKVQVYDRKLDKIVTLSEKDADYSSVYTSGNYLYWTTPIPQTDAERKQARENGVYPAKIHVVDLQKI